MFHSTYSKTASSSTMPPTPSKLSSSLSHILSEPFAGASLSANLSENSSATTSNLLNFAIDLKTTPPKQQQEARKRSRRSSSDSPGRLSQIKRAKGDDHTESRPVSNIAPSMSTMTMPLAQSSQDLLISAWAAYPEYSASAPSILITSPGGTLSSLSNNSISATVPSRIRRDRGVIPGQTEHVSPSEVPELPISSVSALNKITHTRSNNLLLETPADNPAASSVSPIASLADSAPHESTEDEIGPIADHVAEVSDDEAEEDYVERVLTAEAYFLLDPDSSISSDESPDSTDQQCRVIQITFQLPLPFTTNSGPPRIFPSTILRYSVCQGLFLCIITLCPSSCPASIPKLMMNLLPSLYFSAPAPVDRCHIVCAT